MSDETIAITGLIIIVAYVCCSVFREWRRIVREQRMGDIGEPVRHVEFEPFPQEAPVEETAPATPREPVPA